MQSSGEPGPDGLRPSHIKQMTGAKAADAKDKVVTKLSKFIKVCLSGSIPYSIRQLIFGANLLALRTKGESFRPIAVGLKACFESRMRRHARNSSNYP